ncbi:MAG: GNAT family N-acetyltransferase, partial [Rhodothermales bacterium]|nr:GNAT family N-acetyltransferase [Rhodothermales bacterium]
MLITRPGRDNDRRHIRFPEPLNDRLALVDEHNGRIKLYGSEASDFDSEAGSELISSFEASDDFSKMIVYSDSSDETGWEDIDFRFEGTIRGFFFDGSDARMWARFGSEERATEADKKAHDGIVETAREKAGGAVTEIVPDEFTVSRAGPNDAEPIANLMQSVFEDYSEDISEERLKQLIGRGGAAFRTVKTETGRIVASAAVRLDLGRRNGEVTDCVTHPDHRGRGLMAALLKGLEKDASTRFGVTDLYSLSRSGEAGMNIVLARSGYEYTGRLVNNCRMPDGLES